MVKIREAVLEKETAIADYIDQHANTFSLDANLVRALITQESRFNGDISSPTGAFGFGQFTKIGAKQVQNISHMNPLAADLSEFTKEQASDPDVGIKAICATLWWLFERKYDDVINKRVQLEAVLTFYNAGGIPAALVIKHDGHANALSKIKKLPPHRISQSPVYAPEVLAWYVAWTDHFAKQEPVPVVTTAVEEKPVVVENDGDLNPSHAMLIKLLEGLAEADKSIDFTKNTGCSMTEVTLIFPGEGSE